MNSISSMAPALNTFIRNCDDTINQLSSARRTEWCDAATSNSSFFGFCISALSSSKNYSAAEAVDSLQRQASGINCLLSQSPLSGRIRPLDTFFNGSGIRQAESAEHSLLPNIFGGSYYSSYASIDTAGQLSNTLNRIQSVRNQAIGMSQAIPYGQPPMGCQSPEPGVYASYGPCESAPQYPSPYSRPSYGPYGPSPMEQECDQRFYSRY
ncbi:MAG: hypothetical protein H0X29_02555 [Parachlamydiaceae bacterium]|nr:hypothetical protein [Parachlamydiaceae bacterium]